MRDPPRLVAVVAGRGSIAVVTAPVDGADSVFEFRATRGSRRALKSVKGDKIAGVQVLLADGRPVELPDELAAVLRTAVREAVGGHDLALLRRDDEVSPARAGELLGFSRQYVDRLIAEGVLPCRRLPDSTHRKVRVADVLALADRRERRSRIISDMVDEMVEAGAEY